MRSRAQTGPQPGTSCRWNNSLAAVCCHAEGAGAQTRAQGTGSWPFAFSRVVGVGVGALRYCLCTRIDPLGYAVAAFVAAVLSVEVRIFIRGPGVLLAVARGSLWGRVYCAAGCLGPVSCLGEARTGCSGVSVGGVSVVCAGVCPACARRNNNTAAVAGDLQVLSQGGNWVGGGLCSEEGSVIGCVGVVPTPLIAERDALFPGANWLGCGCAGG